MDAQLGRAEPLLILKYLDYTGSFLAFYQQGLRALERFSLAQGGQQFARASSRTATAIVEALALGRRALVAETSGLTELAVAGQVASVPLDSDPVALAARMDEVMSEPVPPPAEVPSWQASADELEDVYRSLTRRRESRTAATQQLHG